MSPEILQVNGKLLLKYMAHVFLDVPLLMCTDKVQWSSGPTTRCMRCGASLAMHQAKPLHVPAFRSAPNLLRGMHAIITHLPVWDARHNCFLFFTQMT